MPPLTFKNSRAKDFPDILDRCRNFKRFSKEDIYSLKKTDANELQF